MSNRKQEKSNTKQSFQVCFCFKRKFKLKAPEPPEDVIDLFDLFSDSNGTMSIDHLHRFLIESQGEENATKEDAQIVFNSLKHLYIFPRKDLDLQAFFRYLLSDLNSPLPPPRVHHDMNAPLAHYFLYTGHNSYLTGNQVSSAGSVEPIIKALNRGVRVIELDLWPNSRRDNVEVRHGGTLTAPVELIKCLVAIKDHAFAASEYPVVITFEDHLPPNLQANVAKMVNKTFGDMLFRPESESLDEFPSPESLKKKIMISTKPPKEYLETQISKGTSEKEHRGKEKTYSKNEIETNDQPDYGDHLQEENEENAAPEYRSLIAIHAGKLEGPLEDQLSHDSSKARRLSLSEQSLETAVKNHAADIIRFTQRNLLRVYPKGLRLDSSNYNPFIGWMHGAQMVAFNMQGHGRHLWTMQGMFRANGGCGYVKKPDFLLNFNPYDGVSSRYDNLPVKKILKVKVYMGEGWSKDFRRTHFDRYSPPDFFTKVGISGVPADKAIKKTQIIEDEWQPVWDEEFQFKLRVPELALLRIEVHEYDTSGKDDFGGQICLPVSELRTGIRSVPLCDRKGERLPSVRLLVRFQLTDVDW